MWEKQYGATKAKRLSDLVAVDRGWPGDDVRRGLLDLLWKEVATSPMDRTIPRGRWTPSCSTAAMHDSYCC